MAKERVVTKEGPFWTLLHYLTIVFTFGGNRRFLTDYLTTIGPIIGIPTSWGPYPFDARWSGDEVARREAILAHERVHIAQFTRYGLGSAWLGVLVMGILYFLVPLPIGLAWFRWRFEREAYAVGIEAKLAHEMNTGQSSSQMEIHRAELIDDATIELAGAHYGFAWPFKKAVRRWFEQNVEHFVGRIT